MRKKHFGTMWRRLAKLEQLHVDGERRIEIIIDFVDSAGHVVESRQFDKATGTWVSVDIGVDSRSDFEGSAERRRGSSANLREAELPSKKC